MKPPSRRLRWKRHRHSRRLSLVALSTAGILASGWFECHADRPRHADPGHPACASLSAGTEVGLSKAVVLAHGVNMFWGRNWKGMQSALAYSGSYT